VYSNSADILFSTASKIFVGILEGTLWSEYFSAAQVPVRPHETSTGPDTEPGPDNPTTRDIPQLLPKVVDKRGDPPTVGHVE